MSSTYESFIVLTAFAAVILILVIYARFLKAKLSKLKEKKISLENEVIELNRKYKDIIDMDDYCERVNKEAKSSIEEAKEKLKNANLVSERIINNSTIQSKTLLDQANAKAKEIAGSAYEIKGKADLYENTVNAMKNIINGYKDEYMIPGHSLLDDLAEEYSFKECGEKLKTARTIVKEMVKNNMAGDCDYFKTNRKKDAINFIVDAFNGKVDSSMSKIKNDNFGKIKQEILDAFAIVNHNGESFSNARITQRYLDARIEELKWAVITLEVKKEEAAEQKEIRDQIREEDKVRKEIEKAIKDAEKEEKLIQKALEKARKEVSGANEDQRQKFEKEIAKLEEKLKEAEEKGKRSLSMAQQTKRGHVYVISNIGSFGENVFKIGMTRRLEPMDRVKELGDASVPFSFDVHAMIYSDDAPALEKSLHRQFNDQSVNKVNKRKEFFKVRLSEIKRHIDSQGYQSKWTQKAEATEYRESLLKN